MSKTFMIRTIQHNFKLIYLIIVVLIQNYFQKTVGKI